MWMRSEEPNVLQPGKKLGFQFAFLRKEDVGDQRCSVGPSAARASPMLFAAVGQFQTNLRESWKASVLSLRASPF